MDEVIILVYLSAWEQRQVKTKTQIEEEAYPKKEDLVIRESAKPQKIDGCVKGTS